MKRYLYRKDRVFQTIKVLFGEREDFNENDYMKYTALEVVVQDDGRFSVWGDLGDEDADVLRDTKPDHRGLLPQIAALANDVIEE